MKSPWLSPTLPSYRHERVYDLLRRLISEGAARFFADACDIAGRDPPYRSATHIIGHLLREAEGQVLDVLVALPGIPVALRGRQTGNDGHKRKAMAILEKLTLTNVEASRSWLDLIEEGSGWVKNAHRENLRGPRPKDRAFLDRVDSFVTILDVVLSRAESEYANVLRNLDKHLSASPPKPADIDEVKAYLGTGVTALGRIFEKIDATWLAPLQALDAFAEPSDMLIRDDGSYSFPSWPQATYLARIAGEKPKEVAALIETIPSTANEHIQSSFIDAGAKMPPVHAAKVARCLTTWVGGHERVHDFMLSKLPQLVLRSLQGGPDEREAAIALLRAALELNPSKPGSFSDRPEARMSNYDYAELANAALPSLGAQAPDALRDLLLSLLAVEEPEELNRQIDSVTRNRAPGASEPLEVLFAALRDSYLARAGTGEAALRAAVDDLHSRPGKLFERLTLHLLRVQGELAPDLIVERVEVPTSLSDHQIRHEMRMLLRDRFATMPGEHQARVVAALRGNSSIEAVRSDWGVDVDPKQLEAAASQRARDWWHLLGAARPASVADEYASLIATYGEPEDDRPRLRSGYRSPVDSSDLLAMADNKLLAYLRDWEPAGRDPFGPSRDGIADHLKMCVGQELTRFSRLARDFRGLRPVYVTHVLWGLHEALARHAQQRDSDQAELKVDWDALLNLAEWTSHQPSLSDVFGDDQNWTSARRFAVDLAEDVALAMAHQDADRTRQAWLIVKTLMVDSDPLEPRDAQPGKEIDFAINTVRGQALEAAITIAAALGKASSGDGELLMAEVLNSIDQRLDAQSEPATAMRCLIASRFNILFLIAPAWSTALVQRLFPNANDRSPARQAAWRVFLAYNASSTSVFAILREAYETAVDGVAAEDPRKAAELGCHLVRLAFAGATDIRVNDLLLRRFVETAPVEARVEVLVWLGHATRHHEPASDAAFFLQAVQLWQWWAQIPAVARDPTDLAAFGWYFASEGIDTAWSLRELERVLTLTRGDVQRDELVIQRLGVLAAALPEAAARCLELLVDADDPWRVVRTEEHLRGALEALLGTSAAATARAIASRLVARNHLKFQDLAIEAWPRNPTTPELRS